MAVDRRLGCFSIFLFVALCISLFVNFVLMVAAFQRFGGVREPSRSRASERYCFSEAVAELLTKSP